MILKRNYVHENHISYKKIFRIVHININKYLKLKYNQLSSRLQHDAKVPIKKLFIHKIMAEAWHGYNQEIHIEKTGTMSKEIVIINLLCFRIQRFIHSVF